MRHFEHARLTETANIEFDDVFFGLQSKRAQRQREREKTTQWGIHTQTQREREQQRNFYQKMPPQQFQMLVKFRHRRKSNDDYIDNRELFTQNANK